MACKQAASAGAARHAEHTRQNQGRPVKASSLGSAEIKNAPMAKRLPKTSTTKNATSTATTARNNIRKHNPHGTYPCCADRTF